MEGFDSELTITGVSDSSAHTTRRVTRSLSRNKGSAKADGGGGGSEGVRGKGGRMARQKKEKRELRRLGAGQVARKIITRVSVQAAV